MNNYVEANAFPPDPLEGQYAGFWRRSVAAFVDLIIYAPVYAGVKMLFSAHSIYGELAILIIWLLTYAAFFSSRLQASPGMCLMKFYVCDAKQQRISYRRALLWGIVSTLGVAICSVGIFYMQYRFDVIGVSELMTSCAHENMRMEDCMQEAENMLGIPYQSFALMSMAAVVLTVFLMLIWSLSVALAKDKTGFHNLISHTRFIKGKP